MSTSTMRCLSDSELSDLDTYSCALCSSDMSLTRRYAKHDIFADFESDEILQLYIRHSKQLAKRRHQTFPSGTYSRSLDSPIETDSPVFTMKDIWSDDDSFEGVNPRDSPRLKTRRNAVWRLNSCSMEENNVACQTNSCSNLTRTKKVYHNLAAMA